MKRLDEMTKDFKQMDSSQLKAVNGGGIGIGFLVGALIAAVTAVIDDWDNFENGLMGKPYQK